MTAEVLDDAPPVTRALVAVRSALAELVAAARSGGLDHHEAPELLSLVADAEEVRNQFQAFDAELLAACRDRGVAELACRKSMGKVLEQLCRISPYEAARRVRAADAVGPRQTMTGLPLPRLRPDLGKALASGTVNPEQTAIIDRTLVDLDQAGVTAEQVASVESELVDLAGRFAPRDLKVISRHYLDLYDPDGPEPDEQRNWDRRFFRMRQTDSGAVTGEFRLTAATGARLAAVLEPLAQPRPAVPGSETLTSDLRTRDQRLHDALDDACSRLLRSDDLPMCGGTPASVIITVDAEDLLRRTGQAVTSGGAALSVPELLRLADEAEIYPTVMTRHGVPLDLGRTRRIANRHQTIALIARDGGCSFPGCDRPPEWCERHHMVSWLDGGPTSLENLTLACTYHHHNFLQRGWQVRPEDGLPAWIPPRWIDPDQHPLVNNRILARRHRPPPRPQ
ncbi:DUF222 domain-containing protein [Microlunatus sp. GCM10028923]|uniref:HNH endonuclease signature motif containing protein n=1 Tax=Microlunatus sp. GCM10028923 TaxID=3273400 RepID=UPI00360E0CF0